MWRNIHDFPVRYLADIPPIFKKHQQSKLLIYGEKTVTQPVGQPTSQPVSPPPTPAPNDTDIKSLSRN